MPNNPSTPPPSNDNNSIPRKGDTANQGYTALSNSFLHRTIHDAGHDLKSPLFVIRGYSQLLQRVDDKERIDRGIKLMEEASFKIENIVNGMVGLMDIYTIPSVEKENLSIEDSIETVCKKLSSLHQNIASITNRKISLNKALFFNKDHFEIILTSLIDNAIRHNKSHQDLVINITCTQSTDGNIRLIIEDNGEGLDPEMEIKKLKTPFYKFGKENNSVGIGLAKVEAVAKVTDNIFTVESVQNKGTTCTFIFKNQTRIEKVSAVEMEGSRRTI